MSSLVFKMYDRNGTLLSDVRHVPAIRSSLIFLKSLHEICWLCQADCSK